MGLVVSLKTNPNISKALQEVRAYSADFDLKAQDTHRKWVYKVLVYIQMYSRVDTGRSRAAWTPIMIQNQFPFQQWVPPGRNEDPKAILEGQGKGTFTDEPFHTVLNNNVEYVEVMNEVYGLFDKAPAIGGSERIANTRFNPKSRNFFNKGVRLEEKTTLFESFANDVFQKFIDNAQEAFEHGGHMSPTEILETQIEPPMTF